MKIKNLILSSIIAGSALLAVGTANAANFSGELVQITTTGASVTIWVRPSELSAVPNFVRSATILNAVIGGVAAGSLHHTVQVSTGATPCATTGAIRFCGVVTSFTAN